MGISLVDGHRYITNFGSQRCFPTFGWSKGHSQLWMPKVCIYICMVNGTFLLLALQICVLTYGWWKMHSYLSGVEGAFPSLDSQRCTYNFGPQMMCSHLYMAEVYSYLRVVRSAFPPSDWQRCITIFNPKKVCGRNMGISPNMYLQWNWYTKFLYLLY